ncbi:MAG TPA: DNA-binding response regulator [Rhodocyclaceae bacterium]|nr:DNA-binding response regulator [Rhodocyclaceae bacterium]HNH34722.1 DNA-binding response regulator [Rhodocyclaceae bacterium]
MKSPTATVMVIEPAAALRAVLKTMVESNGLAFRGFSDLPEAIRSLASAPVDLVATAAHLPAGQYPEILRQLRDCPGMADTPIVLVTSDIGESTRRSALESGITEVFAKDDLAALARYLEVVQAHAGAAAGGPRRGKALVVEDSPSAAELLRATLAAEGLQAVVVPSVREAMAAFAPRRFRLAVVDLVLEDGQSGVVLIQKLRDSQGDLRRLPIIALSGYADAPRRRLAILSGADVFLPKPLDVDEFSLQVRRLTAKTPSAARRPSGDAVSRDARPPLTPQETRVAELVVGGLSDKEIARRLGISYWTVRTHVASLLRKRRVANRLGLVRQMLGRRTSHET